MNEENFIVKFVPVKYCFLQLSSKWFHKINNPKYSCLRLVRPTSKQKLYFSWAPQPGSAALNDCSIGINATFAQTLNIQEGELVVVSTQDSVASLHQVYLTPVTADDYEILELSRDNVENSLLNQIRIVFVKQVIVVWVSKTMHLKVTVDLLEPNLSYGRLEELSELVIQNVPKSRESNNFSNRNSNIVSNDFQSSNNCNDECSYWRLLEDYMPSSLLGILKSRETPNQQRTDLSVSDLWEIVCRVHPFPVLQKTAKCCNNIHNERVHPFNVFINKSTLQMQTEFSRSSFLTALLNEEQGVILCRLEVIPVVKPKTPKTTKKTSENTKEEIGLNRKSVSVCVRLFRIEDSCSVFNKAMDISCVYLSKFLQSVLSLDIGRRVKLQAYNPPMNRTLSAVTLVPSKKLGVEESATLVRQFTERVRCREGVLINHCSPFLIPQADNRDLTVLVELLPVGLDCWPLTHSELQVTRVSVSEEVEQSLENLQWHSSDEEECSKTSSIYEDLLNKGVKSLEYGLQLVKTEHTIVPNNILITGKQGSGKSRLAEAIHSAVSGEPYHVFVSVLDCRPLKGKKPESIEKIVTDQVEDCLNHQPAVLVLEDVQCLAAAPANDAEPSQGNTYYLRSTTVLKEVLWHLRGSLVVVVATAESRTQIHPQLLSARGRHFFTSFLHIPPLSKIDRANIIKELLTDRLSSASGESLPSLELAAAGTEGCTARDLHRLVDRVLFRACQRQEQAVEVTEDDLLAALQDFVPSDLVNVSVSRQSTHTFASVGGLRDAKELLTEVLIWPNKYPEVFEQCPLRLERGVLLYGAPGTGKTLLASAVVGESGLNFITVKGPELLSKYIGASEEAVRNVFQKAQSARPCILFFDEFDSLAPRRGHDSTGVTDRVVNQLLTQMDGVETLEGVWVVAAASRPDLLDPALLRPGRIGNLIHCPAPDQVERLEILETLSSRLRVSDDVDLRVVAARTDGYTGADLQAILFTAQMIAYDALHQDSDDENQNSSSRVDDVVITQSNLLAALQDTFPSVRPEDRIRFQQIYERFQSYKGGPRQESLTEPTLRVTLA